MNVPRFDDIMFVWTKLSAVKWADAWEERLRGLSGVVITTIPGRKTIRVEVYCTKAGEASAIKRQFGGTVRELKSRNWAAMLPETPPPVKVRNRLVICAERTLIARKKLAKEYAGRSIISIPPHMAFGTGHHATTATVLRFLVDFAASREDKKWSMLDLGTGSGVLAIAAAKLGAVPVWGCDYDAHAVRIARENVLLNRADDVVIEQADVLKWKPRGRWDCVAANLFSDVLEEAFPKIARAVKQDGVVFVSGILKSQAAACLRVGEAAGLRFELVLTKGKWVSAWGCLAS